MIKTDWDYSELASSYDKRADYSSDAIDYIIYNCNLNIWSSICDIGAGTGKLAIPLSKVGCHIDAIEPNDEMKKYGMKNSYEYSNIFWHEGTGENTGMLAESYELVTFGSSFNVCNREIALKECNRILKRNGSIVCLWNHRDLNNYIQSNIEKIINANINSYKHGTRRENQTEVIENSGLFDNILELTFPFKTSMSKSDFIIGWKSHGTLKRQSMGKFDEIINQISTYVNSLPGDIIEIPYVTKMWIAKKK